MRIGTKGQVTIPVEIRERLGLVPETEVDFQIQGDSVRITKSAKQRARGERVRAWAQRARGTATAGMTTEKIMKLTRGA